MISSGGPRFAMRSKAWHAVAASASNTPVDSICEAEISGDRPAQSATAQHHQMAMHVSNLAAWHKDTLTGRMLCSARPDHDADVSCQARAGTCPGKGGTSSHNNLSVPVLMPVQWTSTTQSVLCGSGNPTGRKRISRGCSKTTAVDFAPIGGALLIILDRPVTRLTRLDGTNSQVSF